mmetsp:Transcript_2867/g.6547  ORF Transcript_2867/g.6547 Transcript_2867/m.6547 type:complete len:232 (-) Transcript_2867:339-1034(-)
MRAAAREDSHMTTATQRGSASSTPPFRLTTVDNRVGDAEGGARGSVSSTSSQRLNTVDNRRGDAEGEEATQRGSVSSTPSLRLNTVDNRRGDAEGEEVAAQHRSRRLPTGVSRIGDPEGGGRQSLGEGQPVLWRIQFPEDIVNALVSDSNPRAALTRDIRGRRRDQRRPRSRIRRTTARRPQTLTIFLHCRGRPRGRFHRRGWLPTFSATKTTPTMVTPTTSTTRGVRGVS